MGYYNYMMRASEKVRDQRDLASIAARAAEDERNTLAQRLSRRFKEVFGFVPELGEPERHHNRDAYWIQGYLWSVSSSGLVLYVRSHNGGWTHVADAVAFHNLLTRGAVVQDG